jgi:FAD/FMN-containing dehydrogenase
MPTPNTPTPEALARLRGDLRGSILTSADAGYEDARRVWNAMIDHRPAVIVRCVDAADIAPGIAFARRHGFDLSIRGGGHNIAGTAVADGGVTLDLSAMKAVRVDAARRRAYVQPGATLADVDAATQAHGLATPVGINSTTGIAGLTVGGGFGWLTRGHGMTVDNLVSAGVVTADGERVTASERDHADLFWAIRGGGGNFGVVDEFEFALHPAGPDILTGLLVFPHAQARDVLARYRAFADAAPEELTVWAVLRKAPPLPFLPPDVHGQDVVILALCHSGDPARGMALIEPLKGFGRVLGEHVGVQPYRDWQQAFDPLLTAGARNYWKSHNFARLDDGALDTVVDYASRLPSPQCEIFIAHIAGAANRVAPDAMAWGHRDARFVMNVHGRWDDAAQDRAVIGWARAFFDAAKPYASGGAYVNFMTADEGDRVGFAYGQNFARLVEVKRRYDPGNVFRHNQNIRP